MTAAAKIYVIHSPLGLVKIGQSKNPAKRTKQRS
jgi:hypothetical protein